MSLKCFYVRNGAPVGPVSPEELKALGEAGTFLPDALVWIEGTPDWQPFNTWTANLDTAPAPIVAPGPIDVESPPAESETKQPDTSDTVGDAVDSSPDPSKVELPIERPARVGLEPSAEPAREKRASDGKLHRILARVSLVALLAVIALRVLGQVPVGAKLLKPLGAAVPLGVLGFLGLGLVAGVIALFGMRQHGPQRIRTPALIGLVGCAFFLFSLSTQFIRNRQRFRDFALEARASEMLPVQTSPGANRITHPTLGFSLDVPAGFAEFPSSTLKAWKLFSKTPEPGMLAEVFGIQALGNMLPRRHLDPNEIQGEFTGTISRISWRGVNVDALRLFETKDQRNYVTYNIQIPLKGEAIQLSLGAPAEREAELKARIEAILASLDGPSDW
jgi:hypothetical protein